jgi:hypothetical protein
VCTTHGSKKNSIKCVYFNARSIVNKLAALEILIKDENIDILGITDTWLVENITDNEISFNGFSIFRCDRNDPVKERGGGVILYIKNELNPCQIPDISVSSFQESIWCSIKFMNNNINIGVVYRAGDSSEWNDEILYNLIDTLYDKRTLVLGDFNFPELDWSDNIDVSHPFVDCMNRNFLEQYCTEPTRGKNYLDLVFCTEDIIQDIC